jgi:hypothetical protein
MTDTEFFDEPIRATASVDAQGRITLQSLTWQEQRYPIVAVGRQWETEEGRHIMAEAADGTRFELQLRRENLIWYIRKVWRGQTLV